MSAEFVEVLKPQATSQVEKELTEAGTARVERELPAKYKGKSIEDVVKMHQEAESALGRQGGELGELRKITDQFIKAQFNGQTAPVKGQPAKPTDPAEFFADPHAAIQKAIASHPSVIGAQNQSEQQRRIGVQQALNAKHPDMMDLIKSEGFQTWVNGSRVRQQMLQQADANFDFDAADELLGTYKQLNPPKAATAAAKENAEEKPARVAPSATLPRGTVPNETDGSTSKKIYRRTDLIELNQKNPKRYQAMQDEIMQAYADGRVK